MPTSKPERTKVFVSYSRQDIAWLERLRVHLKPLQREMEIDIWDDSKIQPGKKWKEEIANAINSTKVAVLLVSANFLASDFIATGEVPPLLNAAQKDGAIIVPLILSPSRFTKTDLADFESINEPSEPLVDMTWGRQEEVLDQLAAFIETAFTPPVNRKPPATAAQPSSPPKDPARKQPLSAQDIPQLTALIAAGEKMSEKKTSKPWKRPEVVVTLIVAIIALIGTIGAAVIGNMDKIWPKPNPISAGGPQSTAVNTPQPPPAPTPVDIGGKWRDNFGTLTHVIQRGDTVTATASGMACRGPYNSTGRGTLTGNILKSTYESTYSTGQCRGVVSSDGRHITSTCHDSVCGPFESASEKIE